MSRSETIARDLLSIGAVFFRPDEPFIWASGIKSPIYTDNRLVLTAPEVRLRVESGFAELIREHFPDTEVLMGTATAGIAHAALTAHLMRLPMGYVRGSAKDHGRNNRIEGKLDKGAKVVVVEDLISTGGSVIDTAEALVEYGADVLGVVCIFTYSMLISRDNFMKAGIDHYALTNLDEVAAVASAEGYIKAGDIAKILKFRDNPADESWMEA